jgi:ParB-like chromosome segregation protein Spo0J
MKTTKVKIGTVIPNKDNPRVIDDERFEKLCNSIKEFPKMLQLRPIVVDEKNIVLGGNMRLKACMEIGLKDIWIVKVTGLTKMQKKEFIIKDNVGFGDWDWGKLVADFDTEILEDWGLAVWQEEEEIDYSALDDLDLDDVVNGKEEGVKRGIIIEFDPKHYPLANELITQARKDGENLGLIVLNAFKKLK